MSTQDHTTKRCSMCGQEYPLTPEFWYRFKHSLDGYQAKCKDCTRQYQAQWYQDNSDKVKAKVRKYREDNPEKAKLHDGSWQKKYPNKKKEYDRQRHIKLADQINERGRKWRKNNPDRFRQQMINWREKNPEKYYASVQRRVKRKRNAEGSHTLAEIKALYEIQCGKCFHCNCDISEYYEKDHWIPISRGGGDCIENIRLLCYDCNRGKYNKLPHEWCPSKYPPHNQ